MIFREKDLIFITGTNYEVYKRPKCVRKTNKKIIKRLSADKSNSRLSEKIIDYSEKRIRKAKREILKNPNSIKVSRKKIPHDKLKKMILEFIRITKDDFIVKEELAFKFNTYEHKVEDVFRELNREGILSQRKAQYVHDTNRHPMFPMDVSGWACDKYYIRKKN